MCVTYRERKAKLAGRGDTTRSPLGRLQRPPFYQNFYRDFYEPRDGYFYPATGPGFGDELDQSKVLRQTER